MGFTEILTIVFIVLKLIGIINWSWWYIGLPEIIAFVLYIAVFVYGVVSRYQIRKEYKKMYDNWNKFDF